MGKLKESVGPLLSRGGAMLGSGLASIALFAAMAGYLLQGKYLTGMLRPEGMLAFALVLSLQALFALGLRVWRIKEGYNPPPALRLRHGSRDSDSVLRAAFEEGYREQGGDREGNRLLSRGARKALFLEAAAYAALLWTLCFGAVNYAVGVRGGIALAPGGEWASFAGNLEFFQRGFAARPERLSGALRVEKIRPAVSGEPSAVTFLYKGADGAVSTVRELPAGKVWGAPQGSIVFLGDAFLIQPLVVEKEHDYFSKSVYLYPGRSGGRAIYRGALDLAEPGSSGEALYDPQRGVYRLSVSKDGKPACAGEFPFGGDWRGDGFYLRVNSYSHLARFSVMWNSYRNQVLWGVAALALAALLRLAARPRYLVLREGEGEIRWGSNSRKLTRRIRELVGE